MSSKEFTYWFAVYVDYDNTSKKETRIAQIANPIDGLSCEILANPGAIRLYADNYMMAYRTGKLLAKSNKCKKLEIDLEGYSYKLINIK